jgi:hypothetical protein
MTASRVATVPAATQPSPATPVTPAEPAALAVPPASKRRGCEQPAVIPRLRRLQPHQRLWQRFPLTRSIAAWLLVVREFFPRLYVRPVCKLCNCFFFCVDCTLYRVVVQVFSKKLYPLSLHPGSPFVMKYRHFTISSTSVLHIIS